MIYTVTISPAIDYVVHLDRLQKGATNRSTGEEYFLGGKGINVSQILKELGMESIVLGFVNGFTGKALENGLHQGEIKTDFIYPKQGITRINVKIKAGEETEINGQGTIADESDLRMLYDKIRKLQDRDDHFREYPGRCSTGYLQQTSGSSERKRCSVYRRYQWSSPHGCTEVSSIPDQAKHG